MVAPLVALTACGGSSDPSADPATSTTVAPAATSVGATGSASPTTHATGPTSSSPVTTLEQTMPSDLQTPVDLATRDLAERLDVDPASIEVVRVEGVTWPDGSLGCPEPGMNYTQALVDGYRIELRVDGTTYLFHGRTDGDPFECPAERATDPIANPDI